MRTTSPTTVIKCLVLALVAGNACLAEEATDKKRTWDKDPDGVQVFILAGQSNMVGHGKSDLGHGDVKGAVGSLRHLVETDPAKYPAFKGNVTTTDTRPFWRDPSKSPSDFGFHWNHNAESTYLNGQAMGKGMLKLLAP